VVANYLQAIANQTIKKQDFNPSMLKKLDVATCSRLIQEVFLRNKNAKYITWTQLSIFVAVFYRLFIDFSSCPHFFVAHVPHQELRMDLVKTLLQSSNQFASLSVEAVRHQQRSSGVNQPTRFSDAIIRWDQTEPFTMVFTATNDPLFVYKKPSDVPKALVNYFKRYYEATGKAGIATVDQMFPDYNNLTHTDFFIKLASLSRKYFNKSVCLKCFRQYGYEEQRCQRCSTKDLLVQPMSFDPVHIKDFQQDIAKQLQTDYVLTPDNFIKMLLIYMRVKSGVPVLIMGETGNT
jgi:ribosomal protein L40E